MAKRVLITGASGLLGREIYKSFSQEKWDVLGLAFSRVKEGLRKVDLLDKSQVECVLDEFKPSVVVHSAAERRPDVVQNQTESALALNVSATDTLASLCASRNIFLLFISTDYVFDGKDAPYKTVAPTNPINTYGRSKRDGEVAVLKYPGNGVLRVPILYGPIESLGESAVTTLFSAVLNTEKPANLSDYERRYPTHVSDCAQVCVGLANKHIVSNDAGSVWHWSGRECHTKYRMACIMAEVFGLKSHHLVPIREPSSGTPRPYDCHLDRSDSESVFETQDTDFKQGIRLVLEPFLPKQN